jgi:hypothetical protein
MVPKSRNQHTGSIKKLHSCKKFTKVRCARHLRKHSVSPCTLTLSGTSSTVALKLFKMLAFLDGRKAVTKNSTKKALRKKYFHQKQSFNNHTESTIWTVLHKLSKFQEISCTRWQTRLREIFKTWIFSHFVSSNAISLHDFKLILCMLGRLHELQYEIQKPIPKGPRVINSVYYKTRRSTER